MTARARLRAAVAQVEWLARGLIGRARHGGDAVKCPCCGSTYLTFADRFGENRQCWRCGSLERDRLLWLLFDSRPELLSPELDLLHVAPERCLRPRLQRVADRYVAGQIDPEPGELRLDVTALPFPDRSFDALICDHVLEHVPDDRRAMRELRRVLRPGGWAILLVPDVEGERTDEDPDAGPTERLRRFGQVDHVRRYGWDYLDRLTEAGFAPQVLDLSLEIPPEQVERHRLVKFGRMEPIFLCR